jgi:ABC-type uncharacterized transport system permease subunit
MIRIEARETLSIYWKLGLPVMSALLALLLASLPLNLAGAPILESYKQMVIGVLGSKFAISEMLTRATPLIFTGLAATLAFRAKLWNIGAEGQLYLGAMAAVSVGTGSPSYTKNSIWCRRGGNNSSLKFHHHNFSAIYA